MKEAHPFTVLIADDEQEVRYAMGRYFARDSYRLLFAEDGASALSCMLNRSVDVVLLDLKLPDMNGFEVLKCALEQRPDLKIIILTGYGGVAEAVKAIKIGAIDFMEKSANPSVLRRKISQVHQAWRLERENMQLREHLGMYFQYNDLIGESPPMLKLKDMIARIGPTNTSVLIQGESGTGKELVARAVHHHSARRSEVFMPVDCAAINETVMESELFGHSKGAFTGAEQATLGLIRSADKGTLFLDEVGELSMAMQAKLLRTIQESVVRPVGANKMIPVDIRIVAATNRDLVAAIADGTFRRDLYYRISAVTLYAPLLRERGNDILLLCRHFIKKLAGEGIAAKEISRSAETILQGYAWPGNVRELENVIRGATVFSLSDAIMPSDLSSISGSPAVPGPESDAGAESLSAYEAEAIRNALDRTSGNRRKAAKLLGISEATLYRRLKQYQV